MDTLDLSVVLLSMKIISSQVPSHYWLKSSIGSADLSIRKWNLNGECILTIKAHDKTLGCLMVFNGELYSTSNDMTIKQWTLDGSLTRVYKGHTKSVRCVSIWQGALFSGSYDDTIIQ